MSSLNARVFFTIFLLIARDPQFPISKKHLHSFSEFGHGKEKNRIENLIYDGIEKKRKLWYK